MSLEIPRVHLNGTSKEQLLEAIEEAYAKINDALQALAQTAPNGRDYYVKPNSGQALNRATDEHITRMEKLRDVQRQLQELAEGIDKQG